MEGGKSSTTDAELEARLKRVVAENLVDYTHNYLILIVVYMYVLLFTAQCKFIPQVIISAGLLVGMFGICAVGITLNLNFRLLEHIKEREIFLRYRFRWKMAAALLLLQPRAYPLMIQFLKLVEAEEKGGEDEEDSLV